MRLGLRDVARTSLQLQKTRLHGSAWPEKYVSFYFTNL